MARLDITVWENDGYLYDYTMSVNGAPWGADSNYRTEDLAIQAAKESYVDRNN